MSELTRCNYCSLRDIEQRAQREGKPVAVVVHVTGEMAGWTSVLVGDDPEPVAYFLELTESCAC